MRWLGRFLVLLITLSMAGAAAASPQFLVDKNAEVTLDPQNGIEPAHLSVWNVDLDGHVYEDTWFYRVGATGAEADVGTLTLVSSTLMDLDADFGNETLAVTYRLAGVFDLDITYVLEGTGGGDSTIVKSVSVTDLRTSGGAQSINLFQYIDYDLFTSDNDASATLLSTGHIRQTDEVSTSVGEVEVMSGVQPTAWEIDEYDELRLRFEDGDADDLSSSDITTGGILDYTFAFQWDLSLNPGQSLGFVKENRLTVIPEPATSVALVAGGLLLFALRRRA